MHIFTNNLGSFQQALVPLFVCSLMSYSLREALQLRSRKNSSMHVRIYGELRKILANLFAFWVEHWAIIMPQFLFD